MSHNKFQNQKPRNHPLVLYGMTSRFFNVIREDICKLPHSKACYIGCKLSCALEEKAVTCSREKTDSDRKA